MYYVLCAVRGIDTLPSRVSITLALTEPNGDAIKAFSIHFNCSKMGSETLK